MEKTKNMGFPSPAQDYAESRISLDKEIIKHPNSTYYMRMEGLGMVNAFIPPNALLVIDRSLTPENMDIVVAEIEGEFRVRYLQTNEYKTCLIAGNRKIPDLPITSEMGVKIWGVVVAVVVEPQKMKNVRAD
jgi:DNA polymerase V